MLSDVRVLTARRAYEFTSDHLRLSALSNQQFITQMQIAFGFQGAAIATPPPTVDAVPNTYPPGLVFQLGVWSDGDQTVPIRAIYFEASRIVIDVAAYSSAITGVYKALLDIVGAYSLPDGSTAVGEAVRERNMSQMHVRADGFLYNLLNSQIRGALGEAFGDDTSWVPRLQLVQMKSGGYPGVAADALPQLLTLELRANTRVDDHIIFSEALLDTDAHIKLLKEVEQSLGGS